MRSTETRLQFPGLGNDLIECFRPFLYGLDHLVQATEVIEQNVLAAIESGGLGPARATLRRAPAWTTDWITEEGKRKLNEYGIAPPGPTMPDEGVPIRIFGRKADSVACPRCGSRTTERLSAFGSTACKAMYRCLACREPFEHFKPI